MIEKTNVSKNIVDTNIIYGTEKIYEMHEVPGAFKLVDGSGILKQMQRIELNYNPGNLSIAV